MALKQLIFAVIFLLLWDSVSGWPQTHLWGQQWCWSPDLPHSTSQVRDNRPRTTHVNKCEGLSEECPRGLGLQLVALLGLFQRHGLLGGSMALENRFWGVKALHNSQWALCSCLWFKTWALNLPIQPPSLPPAASALPSWTPILRNHKPR